MKYVYILKAGENHYKVGISLNVTKRLKNIQTSNGHKVYVVASRLCKDAARVEQNLHHKLRLMTSGGGTEWFVLEPEDVLRLCILLNTEPEIDVFVNVDLNEQLQRQNRRHKSLEKKLDLILNNVQTRRFKKTIVENEDTGVEEVLVDRNELREQEDKKLFNDALNIVMNDGRASTSLLQRRLRIGYGRAARLMDDLERMGKIGAPDGNRPRTYIEQPATMTS